MGTRLWARWRWAMLMLGVLYAAAVLYVLPFATNDGPVHLSFAHWLGGADGAPLQARHYQRNSAFTPNLAVYGLLALLLKAVPPPLAEAVVQLLCLLGPAAAMAMLLAQFRRGQAWIALYAFPLSLHQLFFLGLYNYCLSLSGFFAESDGPAMAAKTAWPRACGSAGSCRVRYLFRARVRLSCRRGWRWRAAVAVLFGGLARAGHGDGGPLVASAALPPLAHGRVVASAAAGRVGV